MCIRDRRITVQGLVSRRQTVSDYCFVASSLPAPTSLLKLPNDNGDGYDDVNNHEDDGFNAISSSRQR